MHLKTKTPNKLHNNALFYICLVLRIIYIVINFDLVIAYNMTGVRVVETYAQNVFYMYKYYYDKLIVISHQI